MIATILDIQSGHTTIHPHDQPVLEWTENNYSCDCNRQIAFGITPSNGTCLGCHRYILIDATGDLEGWSKEHILQEANREYALKLAE